MISFPDRISRTERKRLRGGKKAAIALSLALILLCLVFGKSYRDEIGRFLANSLFNTGDNSRFIALADSLIISTTADFDLTDSLLADSAITGTDGQSYRRYRQAWPSRLPFEFFVERIQKVSRERGLDCSCAEFKDRAECSLARGNNIVGMIKIEADRLTGLADRSLAIILKNPGALKNEQITELIDSGILFAYIGSANTFPSGKTKESYEKAGVSTLLEIPGKEADIFKPPDKKSKSAKKKEKKTDDLAVEILRRHPNTKAFYFDKSKGYDLPFVSSVLREARTTGIAYLYENSMPDIIDSLAYSNGLQIIRMKNIAELPVDHIGEFKTALLSGLIFPDYPSVNIVMITVRNGDTRDLIELAKTVRSVGVKLVNYIELTHTTENLLRID